jgi:hypothetical protein
MKVMIFIGVTIVGTLGGWIGALMDHGNWLGLWSIFLTTIGSFIGIWAGFKAGQYLGM